MLLRKILSSRSNRSAATLIEVLVDIAIIAILVALLFPIGKVSRSVVLPSFQQQVALWNFQRIAN